MEKNQNTKIINGFTGITVKDFANKLDIEDNHARSILNFMKTKGLATVTTIKGKGRGKGMNTYDFIPDASSKFGEIIKTAFGA
jgi:predicted ArsR family transcriptional regulator